MWLIPWFGVTFQLIEQSNPTAYKVTQICYYFEYLTVLTVNNLISPFSLFQVSIRVSYFLGVILWLIIWVTFLVALGLLWSFLGVTLIGYLVWYNQCKTVWSTFKFKIYTIYNSHKLLTYLVLLYCFESVLLHRKCKLSIKLHILHGKKKFS